MQGTQLRYVIRFVADMDKAVKFHRDVLGLKVKFESPGWSEFVTGETTLALHRGFDKNPAGRVELKRRRRTPKGQVRRDAVYGLLMVSPPCPRHGTV